MENILTEITLLSDKDCFDIIERYKSEFDYPLHRHKEYELNFVQNASGVVRIVGNSTETIGDYDLVLIAGENLEHVWKQGSCTSQNIREITIQFSPDLLPKDILEKNQFLSIKKMLEKARNGISFPSAAIMKIYSILDTLGKEEDGFIQFTNFLVMLYQLSKFDAKVLSSGVSVESSKDTENKRIIAVKDYISKHISENIYLNDLAKIAGMNPASFSRFFKLRTHKNVSDYITDIRISRASRELIETDLNISEICYNSGFNNLSNFNRLFKSRKAMTPKEFREFYKKNKVRV
ncbi:MAG: AraC family transcriptional regulator [Bacteroidales bacterium]|nr:AraC family transcriptional regulator [Bacteroidales bacterium]